MKALYDVNTPEYTRSPEFAQITRLIQDAYDTRAESLARRYPGYLIKSRTEAARQVAAGSFYMRRYNVPFYEMHLCETLLHRDGEGFIVAAEFAYQLNVYCKNIFHRNWWNERAGASGDSFQRYIYHQLREGQHDRVFDRLEREALRHFETADTLFDYFTRFVYNPEIVFISHAEVLELFDELVRCGIWQRRRGDLYQIYHGLDDRTEIPDVKLEYYDGAVSKSDEEDIRAVVAKLRPVFQGLRCRFNFFPSEDPQNRFDGFWSFIKLGGRVWFVPPFLVFFNTSRRSGRQHE